ncbi:flagellar hook-length control protein FliK [Salicola sp. Rm-C-2C1-2]|uniref:flagellar hook-length control protein FliK n=1 Tax=Salicola sp. Rm-C-2C1-2 TaxID=3141321 RepID=UPI0032E4ED53
MPVLSLMTRTDSGQTTGADSSRLAAQLERAGLREGEPRLARVLNADGGGRPAGDGVRAMPGTRLLLEVGGQRLPVRSDRSLDTGTMVKVMRAGNELRLMESLDQPSRSTLSQSLANRIPFQQNLGQGLNRLAAQANDPGLPQQIRQGLVQLTRLMPATPAAQPATGGLQANAALPITGTGATSTTSLGANPTQDSGMSLDRMSGAQIRKWISQSGLFRETSMVQQSASPAGTNANQPQTDLKSQLIQLAAQLLPKVTGKPASESNTSLHGLISRLEPMTKTSADDLSALRFPTPPSTTATSSTSTATGGNTSSSMGAGEMLRLLAGMINRLTVNQLHSQAASAGTEANAPNQTWILELPWVTGSQEVRIMQGRLEEYGPDDPDANEGEERPSREREWQLTLALSFDTTGPLYFEINLRGRQLRTQIWAEHPATVDLIEATRGRLETALAQLDLDVIPVECREGQPPARVTRLTQQLVDEHA